MSAQIFVYVGNDEVAIQRHLDALRQRIGADANAAMSISVLEASQTDDESLNNALNALPFLTAQRLVLLANPSRKFTTPSSRKHFQEQLTRIPPSTLVGIHELKEGRKAENHWLVKWAQKHPLAQAKVLNLPKDMTGWILNETKRQGGQIDRAAAQRLAQIVGTNPRHAAQEINKLLTYVNVSRPIHLDDVELLCVSVAETSIFDLVDAIGQGNVRAAQKLYHQLLADREVFSIFGMIIRQFRLLLQTRELLNRQASQKDIEKALHLHPYVTQKMVMQARRFKIETLENTYHRLLDIDQAAKDGTMPLDLSLDLFLANFASNS